MGFGDEAIAGEVGGEEMSKQPPCPKCGNKEFLVQYTELAHARIDDVGDIIEDGVNMVHHEEHWDRVWCASCGQPVKWQVNL